VTDLLNIFAFRPTSMWARRAALAAADLLQILAGQISAVSGHEAGFIASGDFPSR
jgi:hypothetical protein